MQTRLQASAITPRPRGTEGETLCYVVLADVVIYGLLGVRLEKRRARSDVI